MKKKILFSLFFIMLIATVYISCESKDAGKEQSAQPTALNTDSAALLKRGEYLVAICGCDDCHTPKKMGAHGPEFDMDRRLSGFQSTNNLPPVDTNIIKKGWAMTTLDLNGWAGPWGATFAANLSSDETGIGNWTEEQFKKALTQGKWKGMDGNRSLLPPMPWQDFAHMTDEDVKSIFVFLKSTKPIKNVEPPIRAFADLK